MYQLHLAWYNLGTWPIRIPLLFAVLHWQKSLSKRRIVCRLHFTGSYSYKQWIWRAPVEIPKRMPPTWKEIHVVQVQGHPFFGYLFVKYLGCNVFKHFWCSPPFGGESSHFDSYCVQSDWNHHLILCFEFIDTNLTVQVILGGLVRILLGFQPKS